MADTKISALTEKTTPVTADTIVIVDNVASLDKKTTLDDLPLTTAQTTAVATRVSKSGDSITGNYYIQHSSSSVPALQITNSSSSSAARIDFKNDLGTLTSKIQMLGSTNSSYPSSASGNDIVIDNDGGGITIVTDKVQGFKVFDGTSNAMSMTSDGLTATLIDAAPLTLTSLTEKTTPVSGDFAIIRDVSGAANAKATLSSLPLTQAFTARMAGTPRSLYADYTSTSTFGTTAEVSLKSFLVPANTLNANDLINFKTVLFQKAGTAGATTMRIRTNTSNTLVGATQLSTQTATTVAAVSYIRKFILSSGQLIGISSTTAVYSDIGAATAFTAISFNPAVDNYFFVTVQNASTTDTVTCLALEVDEE